MNVISIIVLTVILVLTICLVTFLLSLFQKHRKAVLNNFAKDLNHNYQNAQLKKIEIKELPVAIDEIKEDIYFCNKAVIGNYDSPARVINEKNFNVSSLLEANKLETFYHYKIINLGTSKFVPLNKIDLLVTKSKVYLYHPLEPETITLNKIKNVTIFWEKNTLIQRKEFFPGVGFNCQKRSYFLLFQTYNEMLKFLTCLNLTYLL
ncbi:hypothetical protein [Spiroplasma platyhelix]|uniref:Uncharacterized protein n=1 Tax=Spiroplasma platyhelix PALS-1 TaxID=1276218 RepID=A0A846TSW1_9MOLU|nr:hypothetical protein [Spiroplasma platyhelix]MBE4704222.1 hypothetical protein [Spiroplasma platyhelix PALS-1]NKE38595.1 hypothetical protein [Spiroplasma platyhelix PALS-1]UJB28806.1 hypothetical protein SPLAT_v1c00390 [Spiroplasma platyhelix PALS-1]